MNEEQEPQPAESAAPEAVLPDAVTALEVDGRQIWLVGTAHVSKSSVVDVEQTLDQLQPDTVCVELCQPRYQNLTDPETWRKLDILQVLRSGRAHLLLSSLIMSSFQRRIADKLGVQPGAEMLAAIQRADAGGAELVLVDRPIDVTLKRAGGRLGWWTRIKILSQLLGGLIFGEDIEEEQIEELKQSERLHDALDMMANEFPPIKEALIDERDTWLAQKIREAGGRRVVAVVGAGHVPGITRQIHEDHDLRALGEVPKPGLLPSILKWGIPAAVIALLIVGFVRGGADTSKENLILWVLINGGLSAIGAAAALAHPLTILSAFLAAPLTSLNPLMAAGWIAGLVQAWVKKPTVDDLESLPNDIASLKGFWNNRLTRILIVVALANLGSMIGTFVAGSWIFARVL